MSSANNLNAYTKNPNVVQANRPVGLSVAVNGVATLTKTKDYCINTTSSVGTSVLNFQVSKSQARHNGYYWLAKVDAGGTSVLTFATLDNDGNPIQRIYYNNQNWTTVTLTDDGVGNADGIWTMNNNGNDGFALHLEQTDNTDVTHIA